MPQSYGISPNQAAAMATAAAAGKSHHSLHFLLTRRDVYQLIRPLPSIHSNY